MHSPYAGPLAAYNSLCDEHLAEYYSNPRHLAHLRNMGLITRNGSIVEENTVRMNESRMQHEKHSKNLLAEAIVKQAIEIENSRRAELKRKLEFLSKIETVEKVKSERYHPKGIQEFDPYSENQSLLPPRISFTSPSAPKKLNIPDDLYGDLKDMKGMFYKHRKIPARPPSPYLSPLQGIQTKKPHPPSTPKAPGTIRRKCSTVKRPYTAPTAGFNQIVTRSSQMHSDVQITLQFVGKSLNLEGSGSGDCDILVIQQHCGASTVVLYRNRMAPKKLFKFYSKRHIGMPFGLTVYLDGMMDMRVSTCCEYRHTCGKLLGSKSSHFRLISVNGGKPCYRCDNERERLDLKKKQMDEVDEIIKTPIPSEHGILIKRGNEASKSTELTLDSEASKSSFDIKLPSIENERPKSALRRKVRSEDQASASSSLTNSEITPSDIFDDDNSPEATTSNPDMDYLTVSGQKEYDYDNDDFEESSELKNISPDSSSDILPKAEDSSTTSKEEDKDTEIDDANETNSVSDKQEEDPNYSDDSEFNEGKSDDADNKSIPHTPASSVTESVTHSSANPSPKGSTTSVESNEPNNSKSSHDISDDAPLHSQEKDSPDESPLPSVKDEVKVNPVPTELSPHLSVEGDVSVDSQEQDSIEHVIYSTDGEKDPLVESANKEKDSSHTIDEPTPDQPPSNEVDLSKEQDSVVEPTPYQPATEGDLSKEQDSVVEPTPYQPATEGDLSKEQDSVVEPTPDQPATEGDLSKEQDSVVEPTPDQPATEGDLSKEQDSVVEPTPDQPATEGDLSKEQDSVVEPTPDQPATEGDLSKEKDSVVEPTPNQLPTEGDLSKGDSMLEPAPTSIEVEGQDSVIESTLDQPPTEGNLSKEQDLATPDQPATEDNLSKEQDSVAEPTPDQPATEGDLSKEQDSSILNQSPSTEEKDLLRSVLDLDQDSVHSNGQVDNKPSIESEISAKSGSVTELVSTVEVDDTLHSNDHIPIQPPSVEEDVLVQQSSINSVVDPILPSVEDEKDSLSSDKEGEADVAQPISVEPVERSVLSDDPSLPQEVDGKEVAGDEQLHSILISGQSGSPKATHVKFLDNSDTESRGMPFSPAETLSEANKVIQKTASDMSLGSLIDEKEISSENGSIVELSEAEDQDISKLNKSVTQLEIESKLIDEAKERDTKSNQALLSSTDANQENQPTDKVQDGLKHQDSSSTNKDDMEDIDTLLDDINSSLGIPSRHNSLSVVKAQYNNDDPLTQSASSLSKAAGNDEEAGNDDRAGSDEEAGNDEEAGDDEEAGGKDEEAGGNDEEAGGKDEEAGNDEEAGGKDEEAGGKDEEAGNDEEAGKDDEAGNDEEASSNEEADNVKEAGNVDKAKSDDKAGRDDKAVSNNDKTSSNSSVSLTSSSSETLHQETIPAAFDDSTKRSHKSSSSSTIDQEGPSTEPDQAHASKEVAYSDDLEEEESFSSSSKSNTVMESNSNLPELIASNKDDQSSLPTDEES